MRTRPVDVDDGEVVAALVAGWALAVGSLHYVPLGGGSHHWRFVDRGGRSWFVTVDDLDDKDWLGDTRVTVLAGLRRAFRTAVALRQDAGLRFVAAPLAGIDGDVVRRLGARYAVSVRPFLIGETYPFGPHPDPDRRAEVLEMVIAVHRATAAVGRRPALAEPTVGARDDLDAFLEDPQRPWDSGPFGEVARDLLASQAAALGEVVAGFDWLVGSMASTRGTPGRHARRAARCERHVDQRKPRAHRLGHGRAGAARTRPVARRVPRRPRSAALLRRHRLCPRRIVYEPVPASLVPR